METSRILVVAGRLLKRRVFITRTNVNVVLNLYLMLLSHNSGMHSVGIVYSFMLALLSNSLMKSVNRQSIF